VSPDGQVHSFVIKTRIFLGLAECRMAVPKTAVRNGRAAGRVEVNLSKDEFYKLPEWDPENAAGLTLGRAK
jgi:hypothetical protein